MAIKIISKKKTAKDKVQLNNQIEILQALDHPNIVRMHELIDDEESYAMILELMSHRSVADLLQEKNPFPEEEAHRIITPIFDAVIYCHTLGIAHRDLKPDNLLLSTDNY